MNTSIRLLLLLSGLLTFSCTSPRELLEQGKYNRVIEKLSRTATQGKLSKEEKTILLDAMKEWQHSKEQQLTEAYRSPAIVNAGKPRIWKAQLMKVEEVASFQRKWDSWPQLAGRTLPYIDTERWSNRWEGLLYDHHAEEYERHMSNYDREQRRIDVMKAYDQLVCMEKYSDQAAHLDSLKQQCIDLGHRTVRLHVDNRTIGNFYEFSRYFDAHITASSDQWTTFYDNLPDSLADFDMYIALEESSENYDETVDDTERYSKEVVDYYETQTDTSGVEIEIPVYKTIEGEITFQEYQLEVVSIASIQVYDRYNSLVYSNEYQCDAEEKIADQFFAGGDRNALPPDITLGSEISTFSFDYSDLLQETYGCLADALNGDISSF